MYYLREMQQCPRITALYYSLGEDMPLEECCI
jgi:hypothetical protein